MARCYDLFCGAGGSSAGARAAGARVVGGLDLDPIACATFNDNFGAGLARCEAIEDADVDAIAGSTGAVDLLLASPECTNHSVARGARVPDETSRATALQTLKFAKAWQPRWIVMENVVRMRDWSRTAELVAELEKLGYSVKPHVLDASDFGVPQRRRRLFYVCDREAEAPVTIGRTASDGKHVAEILDRSGRFAARPLLTASRAQATVDRYRRGLAALGPAASFIIVYYGTDGCGGWQSLNRPLRTLTTLDRFGLVEPGPDGPTLRMLQPPELARAMGLPTGHRLERGTRRDRIRLLGNGVCAPVMRDIVATLIDSSEGDPAEPSLGGGDVLLQPVEQRIPEPA